LKEVIRKLKSSSVEPHHPLAELLGQLLHGIEIVPPKEQGRMVSRACREAVKWHKKEIEKIKQGKKKE